MSRHKTTPSASGPSWSLIVALAAIVVAVFYWWQHDFAIDWLPGLEKTPRHGSAPYDGPVPPDRAEAPVEPGSASPVPQPEPSAAAAPEPKYPLPEREAHPEQPPLPELAESDPPILDALTGLGPRDQLGRFGNLADFTQRFVVTVDNLPRATVPAQFSAVQRIPGPLAVGEEGSRMVLQSENYERYDDFVDFVESLGPKTMVAIYHRFYPLLEQEYRAMGFPQAHFNDRVVEAIDDMLAAPQPEGPIYVVQPEVQFKFEDPSLERLSAGQKIMIRVGPENAARLKKVLRSIRAELAG